MEKKSIELMIQDDKCYIPLDSLNNEVCNTLFDLIKSQQARINHLLQTIFNLQKEISTLQDLNKKQD